MEKTPHPVVRCLLFGDPELKTADSEDAVRLRHGVALVAYLAHAPRPVPRRQLAALLWPDADDRTARARLRRLAYRLEEAAGAPLFAADGESLSLRAGAVYCDSIEFARFARGWISGAKQAELAEAVAWAEAARLTLLEGMDLGSTDFEEWVRALRIELRHLLSRLLDRLAQALGQRGDHDQAIAMAEALLSLDPCNEPGHVLLMRLQAARGNPAGVEAAFVRCADVLRAEFGIKPGPQTEAAYLEVRADLLRAKASSHQAPELRFAESAQGTVAYAVLGDGEETVLVCPGFVSHIEIAWELPALRDMLTSLAARFRVLVFDRRGTGLSERLDANASAASAVSDILAILDDAGIRATWLFGASEGGPIALTLAAEHRERVRGLLLFGAMAKGSACAAYPWALPDAAYDVWLERLVAQWGGPAGIDTFAPGSQHDLALRAWWARMLRHGTSPAGLRRVLGGLRDVDVRAILGRIAAPTLVMHRRGDRAVRQEAGRYLAEHIAGARFVLLEGDDHWWWCGDHRAVLAAMLDFLPPPE